MLLIGLVHQMFPVGLHFCGSLFVCLFYSFSPFPQACLDFFLLYSSNCSDFNCCVEQCYLVFSLFKDEWITDAFIFLNIHCLCLSPLSQCVKHCPVEYVAPR